MSTAKDDTTPARCSYCHQIVEMNHALASMCDRLLVQLRDHGIEPQFEPQLSNLTYAAHALFGGEARAA